MPSERLKIRSNAIRITVYVVIQFLTQKRLSSVHNFLPTGTTFEAPPCRQLLRHMFTQHDVCQTYKRCLFTAHTKKMLLKGPLTNYPVKLTDKHSQSVSQTFESTRIADKDETWAIISRQYK